MDEKIDDALERLIDALLVALDAVRDLPPADRVRYESMVRALLHNAAQQIADTIRRRP